MGEQLRIPVTCHCGFNTMNVKKAYAHAMTHNENKHHQAIYNGKTVVVEDDNKKSEFKRACMRIIDNGANGIVITPDGKHYEVTQSSRKAKLIK